MTACVVHLFRLLTGVGCRVGPFHFGCKGLFDAGGSILERDKTSRARGTSNDIFVLFDGPAYVSRVRNITSFERPLTWSLTPARVRVVQFPMAPPHRSPVESERWPGQRVDFKVVCRLRFVGVDPRLQETPRGKKSGDVKSQDVCGQFTSPLRQTTVRSPD